MLAYVNYADDSGGGSSENAIFMSSNRHLQKIVQSSVAVEKVWRAQNITLVLPVRQEATAFMPYTTCIYIAQMDNKSSPSSHRMSIERLLNLSFSWTYPCNP